MYRERAGFRAIVPEAVFIFVAPPIRGIVAGPAPGSAASTHRRGDGHPAASGKTRRSTEVVVVRSHVVVNEDDKQHEAVVQRDGRSSERESISAARPAMVKI